LTNGDKGLSGAPRVPSKEAGSPEKLVLGYLATHGPTRTVDLLQNVSAGSKGTLLSSIALALEDLIESGTVESRGDDMVSVSGDSRP